MGKVRKLMSPGVEGNWGSLGSSVHSWL